MKIPVTLSIYLQHCFTKRAFPHRFREASLSYCLHSCRCPGWFRISKRLRDVLRTEAGIVTDDDGFFDNVESAERPDEDFLVIVFIRVQAYVPHHTRRDAAEY